MNDETRSPGRAVLSLLGFTGLSVIAGALVTALTVPALAAATTIGSSAAEYWDELPDYMTIDAQSNRTRIFANQDGQPVQIATIFEQNREQIGWDELGQPVRDAALAAEDPNFYEHSGVYMPSLTRAAVDVAMGNSDAGGSTITMQLVRNQLVAESQRYLQTDPDRAERLYEEATVVTPARKIQEIRYAIELERQYTKEEILTAYLNIATFGRNLYGIETAAQYYYGIPAAELDANQAASLLAITQNPNALRLDRDENLEANDTRRLYILDNMLEEGFIDAAEHETTSSVRPELNLQPVPNGCMASSMPWVCDYVRNTIENDDAFGADPAERRSNFRSGGYDIYTTIDVDLQQEAQRIMTEDVPSTAPGYDLGAASTGVEPGTGRIQYMVQNRALDENPSAADGSTAINYNADSWMGGSSGFQTGSTYKTFVLLEWLRQGRSLDENLDSSPRVFDDFTARCAGGGLDPWNPRNFATQPNTMTVRYSTTQSSNTGYAAMAEQLDLCDIRDTAQALGVHRADGAELEYYAPTILGTNELAPLTLAAAFAGIAADGLFCAPVIIDRIVTAQGDDLDAPTADCRQAIDPEVIHVAIGALSDVYNGTGRAARTADATPMFAKTGTADNYSQSWIAAASSELASASWAGNVTGGVNGQNLARVTTNGSATRLIPHHFSRDLHSFANAQLGGEGWPSAGASIGQVLDVPAVEVPSAETPDGTVPNLSGMTVEEARTVIEGAGLQLAEGEPVASAYGAGRISFAYPAFGTPITDGGTVTVYPSRGSQ